MNRFDNFSNNVIRYAFMSILILVLAGCTKKFFYNNLDWFVGEYLDNYVTLNEEQEHLLEERLVSLKEWHKQSELPRYIAHLKELEAVKKSDVTLSYLEQNRAKIREHYERMVSKVAPDLFSLSLQLSELQQREFLLNVAKDHQKRNEKYAGKTEEEVRDIIFDKTGEWANEWIGDLNKQQKAYIKQFSSRVILNHPLWREYRSSIYQEIEYLFENQPNHAIYQQTFMQLLFEPEHFYSESLSAKTAHNISLTDQLILSIAQSMTEKQWKHFRDAVKEWRVLAQDLLI